MRRSTGFTLIELLVAMAVLAIFIVGILGLLDTAQRVAKTETELADTQENVRYAAYHLLRTARMVGGTAMPFARNDGSDVWVAAQLQDNQTNFTDDFGQARTSIAGSDVITLRGFFEVSPFFIRPTDVNPSGTVVTIREEVGDPADLDDNNSMNVIAGEFDGRGLALMGQGQYAIAVVDVTSAPTGTAPNRTFTLTLENPTGVWLTLNPGGAYAAPAFPIYRVGILDSYTYYVNTARELTRVRATGGLPADEPVALNIGSLQAQLCIDTDGDRLINEPCDHAPTVVNSVPPPPPSVVPFPAPIAIRVSVFGRTPDPVLGWTEPAATFDVDFPGLAAVVDRGAKWRRMQVTATLRDFVL